MEGVLGEALRAERKAKAEAALMADTAMAVREEVDRLMRDVENDHAMWMQQVPKP
jgi:hypothetical protein